METCKHSQQPGMSWEGKNSHTERRLLLPSPTVVWGGVSLASSLGLPQCGDGRPDLPGLGAHLYFHSLALTLKSDVEKKCIDFFF